MKSMQPRAAGWGVKNSPRNRQDGVFFIPDLAITGEEQVSMLYITRLDDGFLYLK